MQKKQNLSIQIENESAMLEFAANFAKQLIPQLTSICCTIFLEGELGAGKTTFVRGFLRGLGYFEVVKSPTFTFVESYELLGRAVHHFDLYRMSDSAALESRGLRDYFVESALCFIEWPRYGGAYLPKADIIIHIKGTGHQRRLKIQYA